MSAATPQKKMPVRMCTGCREHKPKNEMIRVVRSPQGEISLDFTGKQSGRGAYLCKSCECLQKARKTRQLERALQTAIPEQVYERLEQQMQSEGGTQQ